MTEIASFSYDTYSLYKCDGTRVRVPPYGYVRVVQPSRSAETQMALAWPTGTRATEASSIAERNLEDLVVAQLEAIEPGLRLEERQKSTPAGRLDLLCRDATGKYVVVELKRARGTDQVVGQILRYMGWLIEAHGTDKVRGIVIVQNKDQGLTYAVKAIPNVEVKQFKLHIE